MRAAGADPDMGRKIFIREAGCPVAAQVPALRIEAMGGPPPHEARTKSREDARMMPAPIATAAALRRRLTARPWADALPFQTAALASLLAFNFACLDFGARPLNRARATASALAAQALCSWAWRLGTIDLRSPLITGLSLSLLLRADEPWIHVAAGAVAILSKFVLRLEGKHIWNPAGLAIVALLLCVPGHVWISPGQWGASVWFAALVAGLAFVVLNAARRAGIALCFLAAHAILLLSRAAWLGDPPAIPLHQLQSGSLLIFAFFMISDPRTTPDSRLGRLVFALAVAVLAHYLAF